MKSSRTRYRAETKPYASNEYFRHGRVTRIKCTFCYNLLHLYDYVAVLPWLHYTLASTYCSGFKWASCATKTISPSFQAMFWFHECGSYTVIFPQRCRHDHLQHHSQESHWGRRGKRTGQAWSSKKGDFQQQLLQAPVSHKHRNLISCFSTSQLAVAIFPSW